MPNAPKTIRQMQRERMPKQRYIKRETEASTFRSTWQWTQVSQIARSRQPICADPFKHHESTGRYELTEDAHHIQSVADRPDLATDLDNIVGVCRACHAKLTAMEQAGKKTAHLFAGCNVHKDIDEWTIA